MPDPRSRSTRERPAWAFDALLAAALAAIALLPLGVPGVELGQLPVRAPEWLVVVLVLVQTAPLVLRRRWPGAVLLVVAVGFAAAQITGADTGVAGLGSLVAIYSAAVGLRARRRAVLAVASLAYLALAVVLAIEGSPERPIDYVTFAGVLLVPCFLGLVVRDRVAGQQEREAVAAERAVAAARSALARDLHDVVTHHVTAMVVETESSAFGRDPAADRDVRTLVSVGATGREALRELRSLLDALDPAAVDAGHRPAGADLGGLVARLASTGYPVELTVEGGSDLPAVVATTLHDVAREALTNAMKHAAGEPIRCALRVRDDVAELEVSNRMTAGRGPESGSSRGLSGMADRVHAAGGMVTAGPGEGDVFVVRATIPFTRVVKEQP